MVDPSLVAVGAAVSLLGVIFWWLAMRTHRRHVAWCAAKSKADGVVSRIATRTSTGLSDLTDTPGDSGYSVAVVRFTAANGLEYEIDARDAPLEVGAHVKVAYDTALPSDGRAVERTPKIGCAAFLIVVGVALIVAGLVR